MTSTLIEGTTDPVRRILEQLHQVQRHGAGWMAKCPSHEDRNPSLSIGVGRDGCALLNCHAGCSVETICAALGLTPRDLFPADSAKPTNGKAEIVAAYDYVTETGQVSYQVVRFLPKDFRQRRPDGAGGWIWNLKGIPRVLYRLPQVLEAVRAHRWVIVVEGEKDADTLHQAGLVATTNAQGAGKWQPAFAEVLRGTSVALIPDNDKSGRDHMDAVAVSLEGIAKDVRIIELPGVKAKGDVSDWLSAGHSTDELKELIQHAPHWRRDPPPDPIGTHAAPPAFRLTDIGNAERLVHAHGGDLRFVPAWNRWLIYDGRRWGRDQVRRVEHLAKTTVRSIYDEAAAATDKDYRDALTSHAKKSESDTRIRAMLARAAAEEGIAILHDRLDANPWQLTVENGAIDLRTGKLQPHRRDDLATNLVAIAHDPQATCPRWLRFLERVFGAASELIEFVQRAVGYSLTGETGEQCLFFLYGTGANGKTTFLEILRSLLGEYATQADFATFLERQHEGPRNDVAALRGARVVTASEVGEGKRLNESLIKTLTGSDTVSARFLYSESFEFRPAFKLWLAANHKPVVRGTDDAIWRRVRLVPFTIQIPEAERDPDLGAELRRELPGILNWALTGCVSWQQGGLQAPEAVRLATDEYRKESDILGAFLDEHCFLEPKASELVSKLYDRYKSWATAGQEFTLSKIKFGKALTERGIGAEKRGIENLTYRVGIRLIDGSDEQEVL